MPTHSSASESLFSRWNNWSITFMSSWNHVSNVSIIKLGFGCSSESSWRHGRTLTCLILHLITSLDYIGNYDKPVDNESKVVYSHTMRSIPWKRQQHHITLPLILKHNQVFYIVYQSSNKNGEALCCVELKKLINFYNKN